MSLSDRMPPICRRLEPITEFAAAILDLADDSALYPDDELVLGSH